MRNVKLLFALVLAFVANGVLAQQQLNFPIFRGNYGERELILPLADSAKLVTAKAFYSQYGGRALPDNLQPYVIRSASPGTQVIIRFEKTDALPDVGWVEVYVSGVIRASGRMVVGKSSQATGGPANPAPTVGAPIDYSSLINKPILFNGDYLALFNRPTIPTVPGWIPPNDPGYLTVAVGDIRYRALGPIDYATLTNKPYLFSGAYADLTGKPNLFSGSYLDLTNKPVLFSGSYNDLTGKPQIPTVPGWIPSVDPNYLTQPVADTRYRLAGPIDYLSLTNRPTQFSGAYGDLTGKPALFSGSYLNLTDRPVLFSGSYLNLTDVPAAFNPAYHTQGAATIVTDTARRFVSDRQIAQWNSSTGSGFSGKYSDLIGKPNLFSGSYLDLTSRPTLSTVATSGSYLDLTNRPTIPAATVIANNLTTTDAAQALAAPQGKVLNDSLTLLRVRVAGKLSTNDTNTLVRKVTGYRLMSSAEIAKLAAISGTNTGDQVLSQSGQRVTLSGGGGFFDLPSAGSGGGTPVLTTPAGFASATADLVEYDNYKWKRVAGTVQTDPIEQNNRYTATQYNGSGAFHYDRQFDGPVYFRWWRNASANNHERLRAMLNAGYTQMRVDSGKYYFDSFAWSPGNIEVIGDITDPRKVQFILRGANAVDNSPNTRLFRGWFWYDGVTPGQLYENISIKGITFINECTATIANTPTNPTGSNAAIHYDGSTQRNITVERCEYIQRSKTAPANFMYFKAGANKLQDGIRLIYNRTNNPDSTRARMFAEIINQDHPNGDQVVGRGVYMAHNFIRGVYYGTSTAGNYINTLVEDNLYENCRDYGNEFAGTNANATFKDNRFGGTHNVLFTSNYHGETGQAGGDYPIPVNSGQQYTGNRTLGYVPGIIEIRGGGEVFLTSNNLNISGGLYLRRNSLGGVVSAVLTGNKMVSNAIASNMTNKALIFLEGATNVRGSNNILERTSADTQPLIQAASSDARDGATGTNSTGSQFTFNTLISAGTPTSYFSATAPNNLSQGYNLNGAGALINN